MSISVVVQYFTPRRCEWRRDGGVFFFVEKQRLRILVVIAPNRKSNSIKHHNYGEFYYWMLEKRNNFFFHFSWIAVTRFIANNIAWVCCVCTIDHVQCSTKHQNEYEMKIRNPKTTIRCNNIFYSWHIFWFGTKETSSDEYREDECCMFETFRWVWKTVDLAFGMCPANVAEWLSNMCGLQCASRASNDMLLRYPLDVPTNYFHSNFKQMRWSHTNTANARFRVVIFLSFFFFFGKQALHMLLSLFNAN